ncbi:MAG: hypothetical protein QM736_11445 [Vicinamibacterales bacterium]
MTAISLLVFTFGHQAEDLKFAGREPFQHRWDGFVLQVTALDTDEQFFRDLRTHVEAALGHGTQRIDKIAVGGLLQNEGAGSPREWR